MVSRHSLYKSKSKMDKATPIQKTSSTFQRKINTFDKIKRELLEKLTIQNIALREAHNLIGWLIKEGRLTKEECKKFIRRKSRIRETITN